MCAASSRAFRVRSARCSLRHPIRMRTSSAAARPRCVSESQTRARKLCASRKRLASARGRLPTARLPFPPLRGRNLPFITTALPGQARDVVSPCVCASVPTTSRAACGARALARHTSVSSVSHKLPTPQPCAALPSSPRHETAGLSLNSLMNRISMRPSVRVACTPVDTPSPAPRKLHRDQQISLTHPITTSHPLAPAHHPSTPPPPPS